MIYSLVVVETPEKYLAESPSENFEILSNTHNLNELESEVALSSGSIEVGLPGVSSRFHQHDRRSFSMMAAESPGIAGTISASPWQDLFGHSTEASRPQPRQRTDRRGSPCGPVETNNSAPELTPARTSTRTGPRKHSLTNGPIIIRQSIGPPGFQPIARKPQSTPTPQSRQKRQLSEPIPIPGQRRTE